eukprot:TRINITY_DN713_c0_g1_i1.p1 TRINITY_DN713_c0_g1~~TRINITY_DN713_c0_g1_i1.p1  ORF type:complete len:347 (+),score=75.00 TRINITY_DN713_c0_g1_i1:145-1041(+)
MTTVGPPTAAVEVEEHLITPKAAGEEVVPSSSPSKTVGQRAIELYHKYKPLLGTALFFALAGIIPSLVIAFQQEALFKLIHIIVEQGWIGKLLYVVFLSVWTVVCFPTTIAELLCGFTFGFGTSVMVSMIGKTVGSILSFLIGKYGFKDWIQSKIEGKYPLMQAIQRAVVQKPWQIIFLTRISMLPIALKNYGVSIMPGVKLSIFSVCTLFGGIPFTVAWSYFGSASSDLVALTSETSTSKEQSAVKTGLTVMGIVGLIGVLIALRHYTKKQLELIQQEQMIEESRETETVNTKKSAA